MGIISKAELKEHANKARLEKSMKDIINSHTQNFEFSKGDNYFEVKIDHELERLFGDGFYEEIIDSIHNELLKKHEDDISEIYSEETGWFKIYLKNMNEAEYKGKDVQLNKPMRGDVKKYKVFVKDPSTKNVKKVNFGDKNMEIKRDNPKRRKSFRARHNCDNPGPKTKPRYWSCKFWSKKSVSDLLNEIIEPDSINVDQLQLKDELCPMIWDQNQLNPEVRKILLKNALEFIKYAKIDHLKIKDIILTGSLANYNYSNNSDLDVHILLDFDQISDNKEFIGEYFRTKKNLWNNDVDANVKGHEVEMYIQDTNEPHTSTGVYSIANNQWLTEPIKGIGTIDSANVQLKSAHIMNEIDELIDNNNVVDIIDSVNSLIEKLKKMRQCGLENEGEFSTENIVFKILRNNGYIKKLYDIKKNALERSLSLESYGYSINEAMNPQNLKNIVRKAKNAGILTLGMVIALIAGNTNTMDMKNAGIPQDLIIKAQNFIRSTGDNVMNYADAVSNYNSNQNINQ